jgi:DNA-binding XRE family transcriptional regulator
MTQPAAVPDPRRAEVLTRAVVGATRQLGLTQKTAAATLGVSEATVSRLSRGRSIDPATKEGELAVLLVRLFRSLDAMVGGNAEQARAWLHAPNHHLQGTPAEMIKGVAGLVRVVEYLDALRGKS